MKPIRETFTFMGATFNVSGLRNLAQQQGQAVCRLGLDSVAQLCNFRAVSGECPGVSAFAIDPKRALRLTPEQLQEPGLVAKFAEAVLLIDGHHRAYRLWCEGAKTMPVYVFEDVKVLARYSNVPRRVLEGRGR